MPESPPPAVPPRESDRSTVRPIGAPPARPPSGGGSSSDRRRPRPLPGAASAAGAAARDRPPSAARGRPGTIDVAAALAEHATLMLRTARRLSLCEDDAQDAVQAAAERFLRHQREVQPATVGGWLMTVTRNEALRVRERRVRVGDLDPDDWRLSLRGAGDGLDERIARGEEIALAREALARLKPQERSALWLQAQGLTYDEIARELSWSRRKVDRALNEGRASLRRGLRGIAAGEGCAAAAPRIDRLAGGRATPEDLGALRPHVARCPSCRARLRRARGGPLSLLPPALLGSLPWIGRVAGPRGGSRAGELVAERLATALSATTGAATEGGLAVAATIAAVVLGAGPIVGDVVAPDHAGRAAAPTTVAVPWPAPRPSPAGPGSGIAVAAPVSDAPADARRAAARRARERAAARRSTARRERRRRAPVVRPPVAPATPTSTPTQVGGARPRPAPTGQQPAGSGTAAGEFGFE